MLTIGFLEKSESVKQEKLVDQEQLAEQQFIETVEAVLARGLTVNAAAH